MNNQELTLKIEELERKLALLESHRHIGSDFPKVDFGSLENFPKNVLATTAVTGFLPIPSCAGAPTGTPASGVWAVYDSTNLKIYVYSGAAWKSIQLV